MSVHSRLIGQLLVVGVSLFVMYRYWPTDIRKVESSMRHLLSAISKSPKERYAASIAKSIKASAFLSSNIVIRLGEPFPDLMRKSDAVALLQQARMNADHISVKSQGHTVSRLSPTEIEYDATLQADAAAQNQSEQILGTYRFIWEKSDGSWTIKQVDVLEVVHHPAGGLSTM